MPKIVKLGELLPEDFVIELAEGKRYTLPGDPPLELILQIAELFERTENADGAQEEIGLEIMRELDATMLRLLQMRDATLERSPFGVNGVQQVVAVLLQAYNFAAQEEPAADDEADPPTGDQSKRSSGSPSS